MNVIKDNQTMGCNLIASNETKVNFLNQNSNNNNYSNANQQQLRNSFVPEVTFSNVKHDNKFLENNNYTGNNYNEHNFNYRKTDMLSVNGFGSNQSRNRLKPLMSNDADADSIMSTSTMITNKKKLTIPDGGYGWVVVFASFTTSLIVDGMAFSFGLIYTELLAYFKESESKTAWIGALFMAIPLLSGPVLSNLVDKYGCRVMTFIGGLIACIGFALASISTSIEMLFVTFGLISGIGIGISYVTAVVSIAFWFDKRSK